MIHNNYDDGNEGDDGGDGDDDDDDDDDVDVNIDAVDYGENDKLVSLDK